MIKIRDIEVYEPEEYDDFRLIKRLPVSRGVERRYYETPLTFDIETTRIKEIEQAVMYVWQMYLYNSKVVVGRTWDQFKTFIDKLCEGVPEGRFFPVYVHNLSFEFQFIRAILDIDPESVFLTSPRRILKCQYRNIEFRCSYLHSNMSLAEYTSKMGVSYEKVKGFDYEKLRFPWTPLSLDELEYIVGDVVGLYQTLCKEMRLDGDDLKSIPYTSTGYVRRELKKNMKTFNRVALRKMQPDAYIYTMLREAFRGGNCHGNRYYVGEILQNVRSMDRSSSYPDCQVNDLFPMGPWHLESKDVSIEFVLKMVKQQKRCFIARIALRNVRLLDPSFGCPYLTRDKCRKIICSDKRRENFMYDNGRILYADYLETTVTDIDLKIINMEYTYDSIEIQDIAHARYGKLPLEWIDTNVQYYESKTILKGDPDQEIYYMKSKNKLNAIYGDTVQDPAKPKIIYSGKLEEPFILQESDLEERLKEGQKRPYKNYAWGVWCTAWARFRLEEMIQKAHHSIDPKTGLEFNGFVYADTDSVKYLGSIPGVEEYNEIRKKASLKNNGWADDSKGNRHFMGVYEDEGVYQSFITWGAKKYAYTDQAGKIHITLSGVSKSGASELKTLEDFAPGFVFHAGAGLETVYNDFNYGPYQIDGHEIDITTNTVLRPTIYKMGLAQDYERILTDPDIYLYIFDKKWYSTI